MIEAITAEDVIDIVPEIVEIIRDLNVKSVVKSVVAIFNFVSGDIYVIVYCSRVLADRHDCIPCIH